MPTSLPRSTPESEGLDPGAILALVDALEAENLETHSLMIVRHGKVVAEGWWGPFSAGETHLMYSLTKSFCSTAIGFAVSEGLLSLDDLIVNHFPDLLPEQPSENLRRVKVRHLLAMAVGHDSEPMAGFHDKPWREAV